MNLFRSKRGLIPSCDIAELDNLADVVKATGDLDFVQGYKIGMQLILRHGASKTVSLIRKHSDLPIIYDHQKFGTDIPEVCAGNVLDDMKRAGIDSIIIFPLSGSATLEEIVKSCERIGLIPMVGGEMTHRAYLVSEGGYLADDSPRRIYEDASKLGVDHFVLPGTRLEHAKKYYVSLTAAVNQPKFLFPGLGSGQGGDIVEALRLVQSHAGYAIVGRSIYDAKDRRKAAISLWNRMSFVGN